MLKHIFLPHEKFVLHLIHKQLRAECGHFATSYVLTQIILVSY